MKAMILAAGLGTRLRPLTDSRPKALVETGGRTLLEITIERLKSFGIRDVIINVHHFADMMVDYLNANGNFGIAIQVSREDELLDTGGGLKQASWFFGTNPDEPFVLHNVDVISTIDLGRMLDFHRDNRPLATLAVQERKTSRYLLFNGHGLLCGKSPTPDSRFQSLGFSGIHVISPQLFTYLPADKIFSVTDLYLRLADRGEKIMAFRADEYRWKDMGRLADLTSPL
jgi:NDP-sugar pyrophosphorylase family protein